MEIKSHKDEKSGLWQITRYNGAYTCIAHGQSHDHKIFDSNLIAAYIQAMLQEQLGIKVKAL